MSGSVTGARLELGLLGGDLTGAELETELTDSIAKGAFIKLVNLYQNRKVLLETPAALTAMFGSNYAREILFAYDEIMFDLSSSALATEYLAKNANALLELFQNSTAFNYYKDIAANYTLLKNQINASGSKLKRDIFLTTGTYTIPANGLLAMCITGIGGGGNGAVGTTGVNGGGGGSGAEFKNVILTSGLPVSNQTVTIGAANANTTLGSLFTALAGNNASSGTAGATSGTATGGGASSITDIDILNAVWQLTNLSVAGGAGGAGGIGIGVNGAAGTAGASGAGGVAGVGAGTGAKAGTGYGSGGGGSADNSTENGTSGTANFGSGGGGAAQSYTAGSGGTGVLVVYGIENND